MKFKKVTIGDATLYLGDCLHVFDDIAESVQAVITDPPYSSGGQFRGDRAMGTKAKYLQSDSGNKASLSEFSGDNRDQRSFHFWSALWSSAAMQVTDQGGIACFFTDWRQLPVSTDYMQAGGWIWRGVVPWAKPAYRPQMGRFGAQCEYVVWGSNGPLPVERDVGCLPGFHDASMSKPDAAPAEMLVGLPGWLDDASPQQREHVTQKPLGLMEQIVAITPAGTTVLDPFMGSGTTGVAAVKTGRKFVGIELTETHFEICCRRIEAAARDRDLFGHNPVPAEQASMFPT